MFLSAAERAFWRVIWINPMLHTRAKLCTVRRHTLYSRSLAIELPGARPAVARYITALRASAMSAPDVVLHNRPTAEPHNLGCGWGGFNFDTSFGHTLKLIDGPAMQALGSYKGGKMLFAPGNRSAICDDCGAASGLSLLGGRRRRRSCCARVRSKRLKTRQERAPQWKQ